MAAKKPVTILSLPVNLLLLAIISVLSLIFVFLLLQRPSLNTEVTSRASTKPVVSSQDLDSALKETDTLDTTQEINSQLQKLSSDASGI